MFACIHSPGIAASGIAEEFSPRLETLDPATVVLDVSGLDRLLGPPEKIAAAIAARAGPRARIALAPNREAAIHAARGFPGLTVIRHGQEAALLGSLPVEVLTPPPELLDTLDRWGIRTFRDLAALPEVGVAERLGAEGVRLQKLARGESGRPPRLADPAPVFVESLELDHPIDLLEPLSFALSRLLNQLCARLEERALAALELRLTLRLETQAEHARSLRLPVPMRNPITFLKLLHLDLTAHPPGAPIVAIALAATPAKPRAIQDGLFLPPFPEPEKLELTLARIAALVGAGNVGSPQLVDTHRPGAFHLAEFRGAAPRPVPHNPAQLAFRVLRPPLPATVQPASGTPAFVSAHGIRGKVLAIAGPWRTSGDWWTTSPWARDDWDAALSDGALCRIYREHFSGQWFVEGRYD
ncbi:MAG: hypothetical protein HYR60_10315 [Acidobacteria bacterium]|nr:hypothetical protein [Acidobacteriota bacterium]